MLREEAFPVSETRLDLKQRLLLKTCQKYAFRFVEVLAPPRGFEPLAGPVLWAL